LGPALEIGPGGQLPALERSGHPLARLARGAPRQATEPEHRRLRPRRGPAGLRPEPGPARRHLGPVAAGPAHGARPQTPADRGPLGGRPPAPPRTARPHRADLRAGLPPMRRRHSFRHRCHGVLAPNSPLRAAVTAYGREEAASRQAGAHHRLHHRGRARRADPLGARGATTPAHGPPAWDEAPEAGPNWDLLARPEPDPEPEFDQRIAW